MKTKLLLFLSIFLLFFNAQAQFIHGIGNSVVIDTDDQGNIYMAHIGSDPAAGLIVKKFNGTSWEFLGEPFTNYKLANPQVFKIVSNGPNHVYLAYIDSQFKLLVKHWDGNNWNEVGSQNYYYSHNLAGFDFEVDESNNLYVAFNGDVPNTFESYFLRVIKYDGSSWAEIGSQDDHGWEFDLGISPGGIPYLTLPLSGLVKVKRYSGGNWTELNPFIHSDENVLAYSPKISFNSSGVPYVLFREDALQLDNSRDGGYSIRSFNGNSWNYVGARRNVDINVSRHLIFYYFDFKINNANIPNVAYIIGDPDDNNLFNLFVKKQIGSSWVNAGSTNIQTNTQAFNTSLAFLGTSPIIGFQDGSNISVKKLDGNIWNEVGSGNAQIEIPDTNFEQTLIDQGIDSDGVINQRIAISDIENRTTLDVSSKNIADLTGIEGFKKLETLLCYNNQLTSIDLSQNTALRVLSCDENDLEELDVTKNTLLEELSCRDNSLDNLYHQELNVLKRIDCSNNFLKDVYLNKNPALEYFECFGNELENLDISENLLLTDLNCDYNNTLTTLDVSKNTVLINLSLYETSINILDVSNNTQLERLDCGETSIKILDLNKNSSLKYVNSSSAALEILNINNGNNSILTEFYATGNNNLTCIQVDNASNANAGNGVYATWEKDISATYSESCFTIIPDENFEQALIKDGIDTDGIINQRVATSDIENIITLAVDSESIDDFTGIEGFKSLEFLHIAENSATTLDISNNTALTILSCSVNALTSLDLSNNPLLTELSCGMNFLTSLDLSNNPLLTELDCIRNEITELDLSKNTNLTLVRCFENPLTNLNVKNGNNSILSTFNSSLTPDLVCIQVDNANEANSGNGNYNNWLKDDVSSYSEDCSNFNEYTSIPDDNFEDALIEFGYDLSKDNQVLTANIIGIKTLDVSGRLIADLSGIENFISLEVLDCGGNDLTNLDISKNKALINLNCNANQLTDLNVNNNTLLKELKCRSNQLTSLDLNNNTVLEILQCNENQLTELNIKNGNNTAITTLVATDNPNLTCIEVDDAGYSTTNWTNIDSQTSFSEDCSVAVVYTAIPDVNFEQALLDQGIDKDGLLNQKVATSDIAGIKVLDISSKNISDLTGIEDFSALEDFTCIQNQVQNINVSQNINLIKLTIINNPLTSIDLTNNINLLDLTIATTDITEINVSNNINLTSLEVGSNSLEELVVSNNIKLIYLGIGSNPMLEIDLSQNIELETLGIYSSKIEELDLSLNTNLKSLTAYDGSFNMMNLKNGNNSILTTFYATGNNNLTCIQVDNADEANSGNGNYATWEKDASTTYSEDCSVNNEYTLIPDEDFEDVLIEKGLDLSKDGQVLTANIVNETELDVSGRLIKDLTGIEGFKSLKQLDVGSNDLTELDISQNTELINLNCSSNQLTSIDLSNNVALQALNCRTNQITNLNLTNNLDLIELEISFNLLSNLDLNQQVNLTALYCSSNQINDLNLINNTELKNVLCMSNQLQSLNVKNGANSKLEVLSADNNASLICIQVDNASDANAGIGFYSQWIKDNSATYSEDCSISNVTIAAKVFLQSPSINPNTVGLMNDDLRQKNLLPTTSPYSDALTAINSIFSTGGSTGNGLAKDDIVDWVWVELRDSGDNTIMINGKSAFLQRDGDVVDLDGTSNLTIDIENGNYFVMINHRNHLGIMTSSPVAISTGATANIDLSSDFNAVLGGVNAVVDIGNGILAMYGGDFNENSQVQNSDLSGVIVELGSSGYENSDLDLNGEIQNTDITNVLNPNLGKGEQVSSSKSSSIAIRKAGEEIKYTFANAQNTVDNGKNYYEVDVFIESSVDFKLGSGQLYFNYNTAAFGENISVNNKFEYMQPTGYILGENYGFPAYKDFIQNDNTSSRVSISFQQGVSSGTITVNNVTTVAKKLFHLKIEYLDVTKTADLEFEINDAFLDQTFTACGPTASGFPDCTNFPGTQITSDTFDNSGGQVLSVEDEILSNSIVFYPNPVSDNLTIESKRPINKIEIYSVLGKKVKEVNSGFKSISVNDLSNGIYLIKIFGDKENTVRKLIKQ